MAISKVFDIIKTFYNTFIFYYLKMSPLFKFVESCNGYDREQI